MKLRFFMVCLFFSMHASVLHAADCFGAPWGNPYRPLLAPGPELWDDDGFDADFIFTEPKYKPVFYFDPLGWDGKQEKRFFSATAPLDKICYLFKAGPAKRVEYDQKKKGLFDVSTEKLTFYQDDKWVIGNLVNTSYIKKIYCSPPPKELALHFMMNELAKSKGGSAVDFEFLKKMYSRYPELFTLELSTKFLRSELQHRYNHYRDVFRRNYNAKFVEWLLEIHPSLHEQVGKY